MQRAEAVIAAIELVSYFSFSFAYLSYVLLVWRWARFVRGHSNYVSKEYQKQLKVDLGSEPRSQLIS